MDHETRVLLLEVAKTAFGFGTAMAPVAAAALAWRGRQNRNLAKNIVKALDAKIADVRKIVTDLELKIKHVDNAQKITQDLVVIHSDRLKEGNQRMATLTEDIDSLKAMVPDLHDVKDAMDKVLSFLRRKTTAEPLVEKPIAGSGGLVAVGEEKKEGDER